MTELPLRLNRKEKGRRETNKKKKRRGFHIILNGTVGEDSQSLVTLYSPRKGGGGNKRDRIGAS